MKKSIAYHPYRGYVDSVPRKTTMNATAKMQKNLPTSQPDRIGGFLPRETDDVVIGRFISYDDVPVVPVVSSLPEYYPKEPYRPVSLTAPLLSFFVPFLAALVFGLGLYAFYLFIVMMHL